MTGRFGKERSYSLDEARRFVMMNGLKLCKQKDTGKFEFVRALSPTHEPASWDELKKEMEERGLIIMASGDILKVVKVSEGGL